MRTEKFKHLISYEKQSKSLKIKIETERLIARSYCNDDFNNYCSLLGDEKITLYFDHGKPRSKSEVHKLIREKGVKFFKAFKPFGFFSLFEKEKMNFIGMFDLLPTDELSTAEIGIALLRNHQGSGFAKEIASLFISDYIDFINREIATNEGEKVKKIIATVHPKNTPSKRVIESLGMGFDKSEDRFGNPRQWYSLEF